MLSSANVRRPATLDGPAVPPGATPEKIQAGIDKGVADMRGPGREPVVCLAPPQAEAACAQVREAPGSGRFDCAMIDGGLRLLKARVDLFDTLVNPLRREAALTFDSGPETTADAVARQAPS